MELQRRIRPRETEAETVPERETEAERDRCRIVDRETE